jgi:hypothetical protein
MLKDPMPTHQFMYPKVTPVVTVRPTAAKPAGGTVRPPRQ